MAIPRKKLLFISPDSLPLGISRAYWLANGLSHHFDVYFIQWEDSRKQKWLEPKTELPKNNRYIISLSAFLKSLYPRTKICIERSFGAKNFFHVFLPVMQKSAISHFLGEVNARRISRYFNQRSFARLARKIKFDFIFHGDNMMLAPIISKEVPAFFDAQDDFDETNESLSLMEYEKNYLRENVYKCRKKFAITQNTAEHFSQLARCQFEVLPNGADFQAISEIHENEIIARKHKLNLAKNFIVSYIGGDGWFDPVFFEKLVKLSLEQEPEIHFLTIGKIKIIKDYPNLTQLGLVSPEEVNIYYRLSDAGILPREADLEFFKNSHPLKIIQYSAAKKPVLMPYMAKSALFNHNNIFQVEFSEKLWLEKLNELKSFRWNSALTMEWEKYSWKSICANLARLISECQP